MRIEIVNSLDLEKMLNNPETLIDNLQSTVFIVRSYYEPALIDYMKDFCLNFAKLHEPSWHPCVDGCPDYHRIHDQYPHAYVKATQHAYYFHTWNLNANLFEKFIPLFELKALLSNTDIKSSTYLSNIPSQGPIARIVIHQYPIGGGRQEEHVDPTSPFARVQTIIQASTPQVDYKKGGLYINHDEFGVINIDSLTRKGDLILASPALKHGVASIDPDETLNWNNTNGRWIIMPIIINSDLVTGTDTKPIGLGTLR
jgi:hypothetical protein